MSNPYRSQSSLQQHWQQLWCDIEQAGGRYQYVQQQLTAQGFMVERKPTDNMKPAELARYKKQLKEEAAHAKKLKTEAWQAYKANHIVYLGDGIYWSDDTSTDKWDIGALHSGADDGGSHAKQMGNRLVENRLPTFKSVAHMAEQLGITIPQLKGLSYHRQVATNIPYRHFRIAKRNGSERQIWAPVPRLKYIQQWILQHILNSLPIHGSAHGFVIGKSILTNAEAHSNSQLLIKIDIKDFFGSIGWRRVKGVFRHAGYKEQYATLLALLCTESPREIFAIDGINHYIALSDPVLPQGAPTSPALTNIICLNLDRRLAGLADSLGLRYSRYADDLTFSVENPSQSKARKAKPDADNQLIGQLLGSVHKILAEEGFVMHPDKSKVIRQGNCQQVTGLVVNGDQPPRVPKHIKRMLRAAIHNLSQGKPIKAGDSIESLTGYAAWVAMCEPELGKHYLNALAAIQASTQAKA